METKERDMEIEVKTEDEHILSLNLTEDNISIDEVVKSSFSEAVNQKNNRTKALAAREYEIFDKSDQVTSVPIITDKDYQYGMSFYDSTPEQLAHLISLTQTPEYKEGMLYFDGLPFSRAELTEISSKKNIEKIDLGLLRVLYGIILVDFLDKSTKSSVDAYMRDSVVRVYIPDLIKIMGKNRNVGKRNIVELIDDVMSFQQIVGVFREIENGRIYESIWPVLLFEGYDERSNVIHFRSPYMATLIRTIYEKSLVRTSTGGNVLRSDGTYQQKPMYTYLVSNHINKERNKVAIEIVNEVVKVIERAGHNVAHIKARTLVERIPLLVTRLNHAAEQNQSVSKQNLILKRAFTKAWEMLYTYTALPKTYKEIQLPSPNDPKMIPTIKTLDTLVFKFPHKGRLKK